MTETLASAEDTYESSFTTSSSKTNSQNLCNCKFFISSCPSSSSTVIINLWTACPKHVHSFQQWKFVCMSKEEGGWVQGERGRYRTTAWFSWSVLVWDEMTFVKSLFCIKHFPCVDDSTLVDCRACFKTDAHGICDKASSLSSKGLLRALTLYELLGQSAPSEVLPHLPFISRPIEEDDRVQPV